MVWDETPHLYGGLLLSKGNFSGYMGISFYPPLLDLVIAALFDIFGASVFVGRLASVAFGLLTIAVFFKLVERAYGRRVAFLACLFLAVMPGFIWLSRVTLLDIALEFFFLATLLLFANWLHTGKNTTIFLCGLILGLGFLTKYQH